VLIPARNEARSLARCLESLREQAYSSFSVTVLDDESTDGTNRIVAEFADRDHRIRLVHGKPLPPGWAGKPWACSQLADVSSADLLLFVDADNWFAPHVLSRTAGLMQREQPGLFSVMPRQHAETFAERLILPGLYMIFLCGTPIWKLEDPEQPDVAVANGQFICMSSNVYRRTGGHRAVKDRIVEDIALARHVKAVGYSICARTAVESVNCRMYHSAREVLDGFSKNAFASVDERPAVAIGAIGVMIATHIAPVPQITGLVWRRGGVRAAELALPGTVIGLGMLLRLLVSRRTGFRRVDSLLAQLNAVAYCVIMLRSMWRRYAGDGYRWKGRVYSSAVVSSSLPHNNRPAR
jgi:chlorobactene glucosyltransferase